MIVIKKEELKKQFLELMKRQNLSIDEAIDKLFKIINSDDYLLLGFNGVYIYMGTYKLVHESDTAWYPVNEILVSEEDPTASYKLFYELDTGLPKKIDMHEELDDFEKNNTIIYIPNVRNFETKTTFIQDFIKLRKNYLKEFCIKGEDIAVELVTSEEYIKQLFSIENYMHENDINPVYYHVFYNEALCNQKNPKLIKKLNR